MSNFFNGSGKHKDGRYDKMLIVASRWYLGIYFFFSMFENLYNKK